MPDKRDYYEVLGLSKGASEDEIRSAYKRLAKEFHPDVSKAPDAEAKFKEIQEAYSVLSDPKKKSAFDQFGHAGVNNAGFSNGGGFGGFSGGAFDFSDLFSQMGFGGGAFDDMFSESFGGSGRRRARHGEHIKIELDLKFNEAVFGVEKEIRLERREACEACHGSGAEKGRSKATCPTCKGSGVVRHSQRTAFGVFSTQTPCPKCDGEGSVNEHPCPRCDGAGVTKAKRSIKVKIPAGIDNGQHLRLRGEGHALAGGEAGDLFVVVFVEPHEVFRRDGADVYCEVPVSFSEAALGAEIDVPTIEGEVKMRVPAGSASGTVFRLKNKGVVDLATGQKGDQFVRIRIEVPKKVSRRQKELLSEFEKEDELAKKRKNFFDRISDALR